MCFRIKNGSYQWVSNLPVLKKAKINALSCTVQYSRINNTKMFNFKCLMQCQNKVKLEQAVLFLYKV